MAKYKLCKKCTVKEEPKTVEAKSGIHIKESQKGTFTKYCGGKVTAECIARGKNSPDPKIRKKATFAANARKWHHGEEGLYIPKIELANELKGQGGLDIPPYNPYEWYGSPNKLTNISSGNIKEQSPYNPSYDFKSSIERPLRYNTNEYNPPIINIDMTSSMVNPIQSNRIQQPGNIERIISRKTEFGTIPPITSPRDESITIPPEEEIRRKGFNLGDIFNKVNQYRIEQQESPLTTPDQLMSYLQGIEKKQSWMDTIGGLDALITYARDANRKPLPPYQSPKFTLANIPSTVNRDLILGRNAIQGQLLGARRFAEERGELGMIPGLYANTLGAENTLLGNVAAHELARRKELESINVPIINMEEATKVQMYNESMNAQRAMNEKIGQNMMLSKNSLYNLYQNKRQRDIQLAKMKYYLNNPDIVEYDNGNNQNLRTLLGLG